VVGGLDALGHCVSIGLCGRKTSEAAATAAEAQHSTIITVASSRTHAALLRSLPLSLRPPSRRQHSTAGDAGHTAASNGQCTRDRSLASEKTFCKNLLVYIIDDSGVTSYGALGTCPSISNNFIFGLF